MQAQPPDRHEADLVRLLWSRDVIDTQSGGEVAVLLPKGLANGIGVVFRLIRIQAGTEEVDGVDHQQEIVIRLQVEGPGVRLTMTN